MLVASLATMQLANWSLTARQTQMVSPATQPTSWNARQWLDLAVEEYLAGNWQRARKHFQIALVRPDAVSLTNSIERYKLEALLLLADSNPAAAQTPLSRWMALQPEAYWLYQFAGIKAAHRQYTQAARLYAEAARLASEDPYTAAIAGERAAKLYDLVVVNARIQDQQNNCTRFLVLANEDTQPTGRDKTSILVYTENKPGALFRVLEPFNTHQVSLTKIETRPARDIAWAYVFFIDFEGHVQDAPVRKVLEQLKSCTVRIKQLGSYPMAQVNP